MNEVAIPWYRSRIVLGIVVSLVCKALTVSGVAGDISSENERQLLDAALLMLGGFGDLWALRGRLVQKAAPVVKLTKSAAELHEIEASPLVLDQLLPPSSAVLPSQFDALEQEK